MEIGEKIKQLRKDKNLSQKELADLLGIKPPSVAYFEGRGNTITIETALKIATALDVSIKSLLFDDIDYTDVPNSKAIEELKATHAQKIEDLKAKYNLKIEELTKENKELVRELKASEKIIKLMEQTEELSARLIDKQSELLQDYPKIQKERLKEKNKTITELEKELAEMVRKLNIVFAYALTITPLKLVDRVKDAIGKEVDFNVFIKIFKNYPEIEDKINKEYDRLFGVDE